MKTPLQSWVFAVFFAVPLYAQPPATEPLTPGGEPRPYMRATRSAAEKITLEIAVRQFAPIKKQGPTIWLVGVVHVGEPAYYQAMQRFLDDQPSVLYEGVGRPPFMDRGEASDDTKAVRTRYAIGFTVEMLDWYRAEFKSPPRSLAVLMQAVKDRKKHSAKPLRHAATDAWNHPLQYQRAAEGYTLTSLGSDGKPGGEGTAADILHAAAPTLPDPPEDDGVTSLQTSLASALGLVFQLDAIDYDRDHFINSDMSLRQIEQRVSDNGGGKQELGQLVSALQGTGFMASAIRFGLNIIQSSPRLQAMVRVMLIQIFGQIEGDISRMANLPPGMKDLMRILIHDRNQIVTDDLKQTLAAASPPKSIAVFYGAGHMHDLEQRLTSQLGYQAVAQFWLPAFSADPKQAGMTEADMQLIENMVKAQLKTTE